MYDASTHQVVAKDGIDLKEEQETYLVYASRTNSAIKQLYSFMV
jgi:hypothetical protein